MTRVRTLPIRLAPVAGEALDSWLEALAHRSAVTWGDIGAAVGLPPARFGRLSSIIRVEPAVAASISAATGVSDAVIHAMTLVRYENSPLRSSTGARNISRCFPWARISGSRYCPHCLMESGGRWQLRWRLGWAFACLEHHCLLADICPHCADPQRIRALPSVYSPAPGRCAALISHANVRQRSRCRGELAHAVVPNLGRGHQIIAAQSMVYDIFDTGTATFGAYESDRQPSMHALADIRRLATHLLATEQRALLSSAVGLDQLGVSYDSRRGLMRSGRGRAGSAQQWATAPQAGIAAIGITAACMALRTPSSQPARAIPARSHAAPPPAERAALGPRVNPTDELRHRTINASSSAHLSHSSRLANLVRRTPTMLWPAWSLRFALPDRGQRPMRPALSVLLLLVDTPLRLQDASDLLSSPIGPQPVSRILQSLSTRTDWPATRAALGRLSDYLAEHDTPIDYQRRRQLDYTALLPDQDWKRICRDTGTPGRGPARARVVRLYLYERLSGLPADTASTVKGEDLLRRKVNDFPRHLTPELAAALESYCREFLASNDVRNEPPFWFPPTDVVAGLRLPGPDPGAVDIAALHRLLRNPKQPLGEIGSQLGTTLDVVRYASERNPAPARPPRTPGQSRARGEALRQARTALPPAQFAQVYLAERKSLDDIGAHAGVGRSTVTCLAREYGIPLRRAHRRPHPLVDRDWLHEQYVTEGRTLDDIAAECGMSSATMCRQAQKHGIPVRPRGGRRDRANLQAKNVPPLLRPALTDSGGWKRLQRFAAATRYRSLARATQQLGLGHLTVHIQRLETDLDTQLVIRGQPGGGAMQLTDAGQQVLAAVRTVQRNQNRRTGK
jgi:hypothetical protein